MSTEKRPTGKHLTDDQGYSAMMNLVRFCAERGVCHQCIFGDPSATCMFKKGIAPVRWPEEFAELQKVRNKERNEV